MRILLVDDHPTVRFGLKHLLASTDGAEVVGEAENAADTIRLVQPLRPGLVLLDLRLGEDSGIEVCREIKALPGAPRFLFFTAYLPLTPVYGVAPDTFSLVSLKTRCRCLTRSCEHQGTKADSRRLRADSSIRRDRPSVSDFRPRL